MLRHSREMTRHHRDRIIAKRKELYQWLYGGSVPLHLPKYSTHHRYCWMCSELSAREQRLRRTKFDWRDELANYQ